MLNPARNQRHLDAPPQVVQAVATGSSIMHAARHVGEGVALLTGHDAGTGECRAATCARRTTLLALPPRLAGDGAGALPQRGR